MTTTGQPDYFDVIIVGAGIAGASLACFLAERGAGRVLILERESQPAFHATGRSASTLVEVDANYTLQQLKLLGGRFLRRPPTGFCDNPIVEPRGALLLFRHEGWHMIEQLAPAFRSNGLAIDLLSPASARERVEVLNTDLFEGAALLPEDGYIDVHELLTSYLRRARRGGAELRTRAEVAGITADAEGRVTVLTNKGSVCGNVVVNAAGAWAAPLGKMAGALPIELTPMRRSIAIFPAPTACDVSRWPLVWSDPHELYFRHEPNGVMLFCPMDEVPLEPCDPAADDVAIAAGIERLRKLAPRLVPETFVRKWAGLRTFSPDRVPVVGFDPNATGFFWLAGQGGCGIETSPILGQVAADLITTGSTDRFSADLLSPLRFDRS